MHEENYWTDYPPENDNDYLYDWKDNLTTDELDSYYMEKKEENEVLLKGFNDEQKVLHISAESPLHPDNPYFQKVFLKWDWIGITGTLSSIKYTELTTYLDNCDDLKYLGQAINRLYNIPDKNNWVGRYSNFRVNISKNKENHDFTIQLSIASNQLNGNKWKDRFKHIRSLLLPESIKITRLDLSFITLLDLSNVNVDLSHSKTTTVIKSNNKETETIALNVYNSKTRVNLYNKKVQLSEKKKVYVDVDNLYNLEFTFNANNKHGWDVTYWRTILNRLTLNKDILAYYEPKERKTDKVSAKDFYYALMYLYVNDKALFKQKYPDKMTTMKRQYDLTINELTDAGIEVNLLPIFKEVFKNSEDRLAKQIHELTSCNI